MGGNYIKIDRGILEWEWYKNTNTKTLFIHCLLKANWKDGRFEGVEVKRGSFVTSLPNLAEETSLSIQQVRTALEHLKLTGELTVTRYPKFSLITVNNYANYQDVNSQSTVEQQSSNSQVTVEQQSSNSRATTIEEYKEYKEREEKKECKEEKIIYSDSKESERQTEVRRAVEKWNSLGLKPVKRIDSNSTRYKMLSSRIAEYGIDEVLAAMDKVKDSTFLKGGNRNGWMIDLEWFAKPNNFPKVHEGKYDNDHNSYHSYQSNDDAPRRRQ